MSIELPRPKSDPGFVFKVFFVAVVVALVAAIYTVAPVFILGFGAIIVAAALNNISAPVANRLHLPQRVALALTTVALLALVAGFLLIFGAQTAGRFQELYMRLPDAWVRTQTWLGTWALGQYILDFINTVPADAGANVLKALPFAGGVLTWLANAFLIFVIGIYLAADADTYIDGAIALVPPARRNRARDIIRQASEDLHKWLIAMTLDMLFLGVTIWIGLMIVGTPFAMALGTITGISVFVPYIGPILSMIPGLLLAFSVSPELALSTAIVYIIALQLEGNVALPLLQRWTVQMPPGLCMLAIVGFGLLFGIWGVLLATPLAVVTLTVVRMAYVEDFLHAPQGDAG